MDGITLSIIIPVYNAEKYIRRCLDSLCIQLSGCEEIILVDDGSKDSSGLICDEYSVKYNNIVVIHSANMGAGEARNLGIEKASGKKILFVDADDMVSSDYIACIHKINNMADLVAFSSVTFNGNGDILERNILHNSLFDIKDAITNGSQKGQFPFLWNKVFDKAIIDEHPKTRFVEKKGPGEDEIFICSYFSKIKTGYLSDFCI